MNLKDIGALYDTENLPPDCVLAEPLDSHIINLSDYSSVVQALWFYSGPSNNPTARSYVFYFFKGDIDEQRRPDEILTFKVRFDNPFKVHIVDNYLGGMASGAINAPALAHRNMWRPGLMSQEGKKQYTEAITSETKKPSKEEKGCIIATAVYGNAAAPEVIRFRLIRDNVLSRSVLGRIFIKAYYIFSPPLALIASRSPVLRRVAKAYFLDLILRIIDTRRS